MNRRRCNARLLFAYVSVCGFLIGCGLPQLTFLASPIAVGILDDTPPSIRFLHDTTNNNASVRDSFRGYSIYYKFYDNATNSSGCRSDRDYITSDPVTLNPSRLQARGYRTVIFSNPQDNNMLDIILPIPNKGVSSQINITIPDPKSALSEFAAVQIANTKYRMYRNIANTLDIGGISNQCRPAADANSLCKPFDYDSAGAIQEILNANDADLRGIANPHSVFEENNLYVAFYGIARGFDINGSFQSLYSEPRFLGYLSMSASAGARSQQCNDGL